MRRERDDPDFVADIVTAAEHIADFIQDLDYETFCMSTNFFE